MVDLSIVIMYPGEHQHSQSKPTFFLWMFISPKMAIVAKEFCLVVDLPLWKIWVRQWEGLSHVLWKKTNVWSHLQDCRSARCHHRVQHFVTRFDVSSSTNPESAFWGCGNCPSEFFLSWPCPFSELQTYPTPTFIRQLIYPLNMVIFHSNMWVFTYFYQRIDRELMWTVAWSNANGSPFGWKTIGRKRIRFGSTLEPEMYGTPMAESHIRFGKTTWFKQ